MHFSTNFSTMDEIVCFGLIFYFARFKLLNACGHHLKDQAFLSACIDIIVEFATFSTD